MSDYTITGMTLAAGRAIVWNKIGCSKIQGDPAKLVELMEVIATPPQINFLRDFSTPIGAPFLYEDRFGNGNVPNIVDGVLSLVNNRSTIGNATNGYYMDNELNSPDWDGLTYDIKVYPTFIAHADKVRIRIGTNDALADFLEADLLSAVQNGTPLVLHGAVAGQDGAGPGNIAMSIQMRMQVANVPLVEILRVSKIELVPSV